LLRSVSSFCVLCPMLTVSILFGGVSVFLVCLMSNVTREYLFCWDSCLLCVSCAQCYPCISFLMGFVSSFCVLCLMILVSIFLCLVFNVTRVYLFLVGSVSIFLCLVSNVTRVYLFWWSVCLLSVSCVQCYPCLSFLVECVSSFCGLCPMFSVSIFLVRSVSSFCALCPMLPVSIFFGGVRVFFLCLMSNVIRVYLFWWGSCLLSVSYVQRYPCLSFLVGSVFSFCVLCPMLPVSIFFGGVCVFFLCLVPNVTRDYLFLVRSVSSFCVLYLMISVFIFLCLVSNVLRVYLFWWGRVFFLCLVSNVTPVYLFWWGPCFLSVSCIQCYPCLSFLVECVSSFCVLCPMLPVTTFFWCGPCLLSVSCI
jgi:hypothetical protein